MNISFTNCQDLALPFSEFESLNSIEELIKRGMAFKTAGKHEEALDDFAIALALQPYNGYALYQRSLLLCEKQEFEQAQKDIDALQGCLRAMKNPVEILNYLGDVYRLKGDLDKAIEFLKISLTFNKDDPFALGRLGEVYRMKGNIPEAMSCFGKAITSDSSILSFNYLHRGLALLDRNKIEAAIKELENCLEIDPKNEKALNWLTKAYALEKNYEKARECFNKAILMKSTAERPAQIEHTCSQMLSVYPLNIQRTEDFDLRCFTLLSPEKPVEGDQRDQFVSSPRLVSVLSMARFDKAKIVLSPFLSVLEYKVEDTVLKILVDNTLNTNRDFKAFWTERESKIYLVAVGEKNKLNEASVEKPHCPDCFSEVKRIIQIELNLAELKTSKKIDVYTFVPVSSVKQQTGSLVRTQHLIEDKEELITSIFI